mgnify:CR=1 FL=1
MLNRLLITIHWAMILWVLCWPAAIIIEVSQLYNLPRETADFLFIGGILAAVYFVALWIIKGRWILFPLQNYRGWGEQKLGRLFIAIHWLVFLASGSFIMFLFSFSILAGGASSHLLFYEGLPRFLLVIGPVTWIPLAFLFIDWIVNGKWIWFPWNRNKE